MLKLITAGASCRICNESKKALTENNVEFEELFISTDEGLDIAKRFNIMVSGKFLYDTESDSVIEVTKYIRNLKENNG